MTTTDTFYQTSGTSPPGRADSRLLPAPSETPSMSEELIEALAALLADALVADIRQYPNLAELKAKSNQTVESPSGLDRRTRSSRSRAAAQPGTSR
jgi:hypothetical protein